MINGLPKCGNHALQKACSLLGVDLPINHLPYQAGQRCLFITRHPRNMAISMIQETRRCPVTPVGLLYGLDLCYPGDSLQRLSDDFAGWMTDATIIQYEELTASDAGMRKVAGWLGVPYIEGAFEQLPGGTFTWSGNPSDWRKIWTDRAQTKWEAMGGPEMEVRYGY